MEAWKRLLADIQRCEANDPDDFKGRLPKGCPNEGYSRMIHGDSEYRERWFALMKEGYLVSKPFQRSRIHIGFIRAGGTGT